MSKSQRRLLSSVLIVLVVLTLAFIWGNSMLNREASSELSNGLLEMLKPFLSALGIEFADDTPLRKLAHFCEYALLGAEFLALFHVLLWDKAVLRTGVLSLLSACVDETIQLFSGRYASVFDVVLDFVGALCGMLLISACIHVLIKRKMTGI